MKTYIRNAGWMLTEKIAKIISNLLLMALIARSIGPSDFGILSISITLVTLAWCFCSLGADTLLMKEFSQNNYNHNELFNTIYACRLIASITILTISYALLFTGATHSFSRTETLIYAISIAAIPFYNFNTYYSYFQAKSKSHTVTKISILSITISASIKLFIAFTTPNVYYFAASYVFDSALILAIYNLLPSEPATKIQTSNIKLKVILKLAKPATPLLLSNLIVIAYTRLDQFMIAKFLGMAPAGIYSISTRIAESYIFIPSILAISLYPMLAKETTKENIKKYFDVVFFSAIASALITIAAAPIAIPMLFGHEYSESISPLIILVISSTFSIIGSVATNYLILKDMAYIRLIRSIAGLSINAILNIYLIPKYGIIGAAYATLASQIIAAWLSNALTPKTLDCFKMQTATILTIGIPGTLKTIKGARN